ncbi:MAG: hypothetical protein JXM69_07290 [Anaerolineae bacterium]|nr:hypothetical protein [Anaerolineae bacterium]
MSTAVSVGLALILPIFAVAPLFYPGYFQAHSGFVPLWNVADLQANLRLGWLPHLATQFDPLRSDGLLAYYLAGILPFSPVVSIKVVLGLAWLLGSVGLWLWLKGWLGQPGALVAALVYTYLPYRIATVYVRGAWGEALFWGLLPWAYLATTYPVASFRWPPALMGAVIFWLLLGLSQLGLTGWAFIFIITLLLVVHLRQSLWPILAALLGIAVAVLLSFLLSGPPSLSPVTFVDHFLYPFQLVSAYWGFGPSQPGWNDGLSFQLGVAGVGLIIITIVLWQRVDQQWVSRTDRRLMFFLIILIVLTLLQLGVAVFVWHIPLWPGYTLADTLTFPWQLLGFAGLCLAVLAGAALWLDDQLLRLPLFGAMIIVIVLSSYPYLSPQFIQPAPYLAPEPQTQWGEDASTQLTLLAHNFSVLTSGQTAGLNLGQTKIPLAVHGPLQANDTLQLNVVWQPLQPFAAGLKVFVHLVDPAGNVVAQYDGQPQSGEYPTSQWIPGELIADSYPILFPADAPPGPYRVFLGLYDEATLARLPVPTNSEGGVMLDVE